MGQTGFAASSFDKPSQERNSLFRRVGLFVKKPYLDWNHTQTLLDPEEEQVLRQQFLKRRDKQLNGKESHRDLHNLRGRISRNRAEAERIAAGGAFNQNQVAKLGAVEEELDSHISRPRAMQSTLQNVAARTVPMHFEGSNFTLGAHIATGQGFEVKTAEAGDLQACLDEAAFCFASGDEISAEALLLQACEDFKANRAEIYPYLLDLYRITNQTQPYAAAATLYSQAALVPLGMLNLSREQPIASYKRPINLASRTLTAEEVIGMDTAFQVERNGGEPCELRFDGVTRVAQDALKPLGQLLDRIGSTPHEFAFAGLGTLINTLQMQSKEVLASQSAELHRARFCAARLAGNLSLFEQAAADFGQVERIPAPSWRPPRCMLLVPVEGITNRNSTSSQNGLLHFALAGSLNKNQLNSQLQIQNSFLTISNQIDIDCSALMLVNFDAAVLLVDWVRAASSVGAKVNLHSMHRLCERLLISIGAEKKWLTLSHAYA